MIVFQDSHRARDWVGQTGRSSRAEIAWRRADGAVCAVKKKITFLDGPAVIAPTDDVIDRLDIVLAYIGFNQVAVNRVESKAIWVTEAVGVNLRHLSWPLKRVGGRNTVLAVGTDRVGAAGIDGRIERI